MSFRMKFIFITFIVIMPVLASASKIQYLDSLKVESLPKDKQDTSLKKKTRLKMSAKVWKTLVISTPGDFVQMGNELKQNWGRTAAYFAGTSLVILADKPITKWYQDNIERKIDYNLPKLPGSSGSQFFRGNDAYLNYSIIALYGGAFLANSVTGQRAALNSLKALGYSYLIVHVGLKALFARQRPDPSLSDGKAPRSPNTGNPYDFFHFRKLNWGTGPDGTSFPSFHATAYYAVAKVLAMEFNNYWIPYGAVTFIFFADLNSHRHWVGDMIAGGLIGTLIGKGIVNSARTYDKRTKKTEAGIPGRKKRTLNYSIFPAISSSVTGIKVNIQL